MTEKKLGSLLSGTSSDLADLVRRAQEMQGLTDRIRAALPPDTRAHLVSAAVSDSDGGPTLTLIADGSTWAARIRFAGEEALAAARRHGTEATRCRVLVRPDTAARGDADQAKTGPE